MVKYFLLYLLWNFSYVYRHMLVIQENKYIEIYNCISLVSDRSYKIKITKAEEGSHDLQMEHKTENELHSSLKVIFSAYAN